MNGAADPRRMNSERVIRSTGERHARSRPDLPSACWCPDVTLVVSTAKDTQIVDLKAALRQRDRTIAALHGELEKLHTPGS